MKLQFGQANNCLATCRQLQGHMQTIADHLQTIALPHADNCGPPTDNYCCPPADNCDHLQTIAGQPADNYCSNCRTDVL